MDRRGYIGGSDMAAILGIDPWRTPLHVYLAVIGEMPETDETELMRFGKLMEDPIATLIEERTGFPVHEVPDQFVHPDYEFIRGRIDRQFDVSHGIEIKNVGRGGAKHWGPAGDVTGVAEHYLPQVYTYMRLANYDRMTVAAYFGGADLRLYEVERDDDVSDAIINEAVEFWFKHVVPRVPPDPDFSRQDTLDLAKSLFGLTDKVVQADDEAGDWYRVYLDATEKAKTYQTAADAAKTHLVWTLGDGSAMRFNDGQELRRKVVKRKGYTVEPTEFVQISFAKAKGSDND